MNAAEKLSHAQTHWPDCWHTAGHHGCAVARISRLQATLDVLLDLNVTIRDRDVLARVTRADLVRVLEARGWTRDRELRDEEEFWIKPGAAEEDGLPFEALVIADRFSDRIHRTREVVQQIALADGVGQLRVLVELLPGLGLDEAAKGGGGD